MSRKTLQKSNSQSSSSFTETLTKKGQQNISTLKKVQNDKKLQKEISKITNNSLKLAKFSNNTSSDKSKSDDNEFEESSEEFKDELGDEDEDIVMRDVISGEEEDSTDSSDYEISEEKSEEENSNEEEKEPNLKDIDEDMEEKCNEIVEDTTKFSSKKRQKEKEQKRSQDKIMSKGTAEIKDPIPTPLLARPQAEKQFRDYYMNQITKAFGEDLDQLRKKELNLNSSKLEILIDTLESGISIFSDTEKELALLSFNKNNL